MLRRSEGAHETSQHPFRSMFDLMLAMVFLLAALLFASQSEVFALRAELEEAKRRLREHAVINTTLPPGQPPSITPAEPDLTHDQPPSITLAETDERFLFPFGSAELSPTFREGLWQEIVPKILDAQRKYRINTIQVIGHTDEAPLRKSSGNLDYGLIAFIGSDAAVTPGSNTDLAMLRAVAVLKVLREHPSLKDMKLVPYSAGQTLLPEPEDTLSSGKEKGDPRKRRRVVIRLTRS